MVKTKNQYVSKWTSDSQSFAKRNQMGPTECTPGGLLLCTHSASFHSVLMACDKLQNCPLYLHRGSSNRVQPEASAFCSALLKAVVPHKCGWLTTVMKFPINTYIIRSSCSTFKRFMYPKKNTAFCGVLRPPSNGDTFCKIQAATLIMHDIHI